MPKNAEKAMIELCGRTKNGGAQVPSGRAPEKVLQPADLDVIGNKKFSSDQLSK
jgi:hypothetical protein